MNLTWFKWRYFLYLIIIGLWSIWFINMRVTSADSLIATDCNKNIGTYPVAIVLGARVIGASQVSDIYADRLQTAVDIYKLGKVTKILVSGDHGQVDYDEVNAGRKYLLDRGVLASDIFLDHAGLDTYDSIYRAKNIFGITRALVVTQDFHLPRALYIGKELGLEVLGCSADLRTYQSIKSLNRIEYLKSIKAWLNTGSGSSSKFSGETYDISGDGQQTWDQF